MSHSDFILGSSGGATLWSELVALSLTRSVMGTSKVLVAKRAVVKLLLSVAAVYAASSGRGHLPRLLRGRRGSDRRELSEVSGEITQKSRVFSKVLLVTCKL